MLTRQVPAAVHLPGHTGDPVRSRIVGNGISMATKISCTLLNCSGIVQNIPGKICAANYLIIGNRRRIRIWCGKNIKNCGYFFALRTSYSASTGAIVFVDIERRTSLVSLRQ
jgi:hypothetical protein